MVGRHRPGCGRYTACNLLLFGSPGSIPVGGTEEGNIGCGVPPAGANYLLVEVDVVNAGPFPVVPELDETNNVGYIALPT